MDVKPISLQFNGNIPLSMLLRLTTSTRNDIWAWYSIAATLLPLSISIESIEPNELALLTGFDGEQLYYSLALISQMRRCIRLQKDEQTTLYLAHPSDITKVEQCPVILGSLIHLADDTVDSIPSNRAIPPKEHGTAAIILPGFEIYDLADLPQSTQLLQAEIGLKLEEIANAKPSKKKGSDGTSSPSPSTSITLKPFPTEVQDMIQSLAQEYHQHHVLSLLQQTRHPTQETLFPGQELATKPKKQPRPIVPATFDKNGYAPIPSPLPMQAIVNGIHNAITAGANQWVFDEEEAQQALKDGKPCSVPYYRYSKDAGQTILSYQDGESTQLDARAALTIWNEVKTLDKGSVDIILDIFSHLSRNMDQTGSAWFFASEHLDHRGITPITKKYGSGRRRAGHRREDMEEIHQAIASLQKLWIRIEQYIDTNEQAPTKRRKSKTDKPDKPKRKQRLYTHTGRVLMIDEMWYQNELTGEEGNNPFPANSIPIGWRIHTGEWLRTFLETPNRQVAQICETLLRYDPYRREWEKAIGVYLMFHGHMQCKGKGGVLPRTIGSIINESSLRVEADRPQQTINRFNAAMDNLVNDHLIDGWSYETELALPRSKKPGEKLQAWLELKINIYIAPYRNKLQQGS